MACLAPAFNIPALTVPKGSLIEIELLGVLLLFGISCGLLALVFSHALYWVEDQHLLTVILWRTSSRRSEY